MIKALCGAPFLFGLLAAAKPAQVIRSAAWDRPIERPIEDTSVRTRSLRVR